MSNLFESIVDAAAAKFGIGENAKKLTAALLGFITDNERGGISGFYDRFVNAGLTEKFQSWVSAGPNEDMTEDDVDAVFGGDGLAAISRDADVDIDTTRTSLAYLTPQVINEISPDGTMPDNEGILGTIGGYLSGLVPAMAAAPSIMASSVASGPDDVHEVPPHVEGEMTGRVSAAEPPAREPYSGVTANTYESDEGSGSILKWLLPLILVVALLALGYMFCTKDSVPVATSTPTPRPTASPSGAGQNAAVESSLSIKADNGKYVVTGTVHDEATKKQIVDALVAQYGAANVDVTGLKVDAKAKPFADGWWASFGKMLPNLKDWKTGTLSFAGNAITEAAGLPAAALEQLKSLFNGWTMPSALSGSTGADADRKLAEVALPDGTKLQAYPGGIESQLIEFVQSDAFKSGTNDTLKDKWFNFDDLNFKFGTTELVPESQRQLDNIVAILKAFPDVKLKIGGYTDKKGDDARNKTLSDSRAKAVKAALEKAGVGAQVPEAEGYGEQFATVAEDASDKEREADRRTAVRLLK